MKNLLIILLLGFFCLEGKSQDSLTTPSLHLITFNSDAVSVVLEWNTISKHVLGFVIEKKEGNSPWLIIGQADPNERSYVDKNISVVSTYYRVRSFGNRIFSAYSNVGTKQDSVR